MSQMNSYVGDQTLTSREEQNDSSGDETSDSQEIIVRIPKKTSDSQEIIVDSQGVENMADSISLPFRTGFSKGIQSRS